MRTEEIVTSKLPPNSSYKIVLVSDIHLGRILGNAYAQDLVKKINAQNPDLVLIAGDILVPQATKNSISTIVDMYNAKCQRSVNCNT